MVAGRSMMVGVDIYSGNVVKGSEIYKRLGLNSVLLLFEILPFLTSKKIA